MEAYVAGLIGIYEQLGIPGLIRDMAATAKLIEKLQKSAATEDSGRLAAAKHLQLAAAAEKARSARYPGK